MTLDGSVGLTAICSSAWRRSVQSWFARGLVAEPRLAQPIADAVASGGASLAALLWASAASCRSSSQATSNAPDGCGMIFPFAKWPCCVLNGLVFTDPPDDTMTSAPHVAARTASRATRIALVRMNSPLFDRAGRHAMPDVAW